MKIFPFLVTNRINCFIHQIQYFVIFHCLYYSVSINESKEKFKIVFCCFPFKENCNTIIYFYSLFEINFLWNSRISLPWVDFPIWRPGNVPLTSWERHETNSRRRPNLTFKGCPWEVDSGRAQDVVRTSPRRPSEYSNLVSHFFKTVSFRTYSIDQIYLKAFQHTRCIEDPVKLLRWGIFWKIS